MKSRILAVLPIAVLAGCAATSSQVIAQTAYNTDAVMVIYPLQLSNHVPDEQQDLEVYVRKNAHEIIRDLKHGFGISLDQLAFGLEVAPEDRHHLIFSMKKILESSGNTAEFVRRLGATYPERLAALTQVSGVEIDAPKMLADDSSSSDVGGA